MDSKQSYSTGKTICSIMLCGLSVGCNFPQQRLQTEVESTLVRSPGLYINPDGDTGAFFRAENYRREFYVPKTEGLNVQVFALRVTFLMGLGKGSDINKPGYCYWRNLVLFPFFSNRIIALQIIFTTFAT